MANKTDNIRKAIIKNRFSIIFQIEGNYIKLLYFLDNRMLNNSYMVEEEKELYYVYRQRNGRSSHPCGSSQTLPRIQFIVCCRQQKPPLWQQNAFGNKRLHCPHF